MVAIGAFGEDSLTILCIGSDNEAQWVERERLVFEPASLGVTDTSKVV